MFLTEPWAYSIISAQSPFMELGSVTEVGLQVIGCTNLPTTKPQLQISIIE